MAETRIRTRHGPLDSVSYRFHNARIAGNASDAVAPCTGLHRRTFSAAVSRCVAVQAETRSSFAAIVSGCERGPGVQAYASSYV